MVITRSIDKFLNRLCNKCFIFRNNIDNITFVFYIAYNKIDDSELQNKYLNRDFVIASIVCSIDKDNDCLYIRELNNNIKDNIEYKYYATILLGNSALIAKQNFGVNNVKLDDASGKILNNNIYYKLGFEVLDNSNDNFIDWNEWYRRYNPTNNINIVPQPDRKISIDKLIININRLLDR